VDKFLIQGGVPLQGEIAVSGAKNSALPALAACLLTSERVILDRIPPVRDIGTMEQLLEHTGARPRAVFQQKGRSRRGAQPAASAGRRRPSRPAPARRLTAGRRKRRD